VVGRQTYAGARSGFAPTAYVVLARTHAAESA